jgi:hypothetical protein
MKNKLKFYVIIAVLIFIFSLVITVNVQHKKIIKERADKERFMQNYYSALEDNADLRKENLKWRELPAKYKKLLDSLGKELSIRPKTIERVVIKTIIQHDTIVKYLLTVQNSDTSWAFTDNGECYVYKGEVSLSGNLVSVKKTDFLYTNKFDEVYYWYRSWFLGKKKYTQKTVATCGSAFTKDITIIKGK